MRGRDSCRRPDPLERLAREGTRPAYRHLGHWQPADGLRGKIVLEKHWASGEAPWHVW